MKTKDQLYRLEQSLKRKEILAAEAKKKGMHSRYGNLLMEISELKRQVRKMSMGGR